MVAMLQRVKVEVGRGDVAFVKVYSGTLCSHGEYSHLTTLSFSRSLQQLLMFLQSTHAKLHFAGRR